jgi:hypothetical protein
VKLPARIPDPAMSLHGKAEDWTKFGKVDQSKDPHAFVRFLDAGNTLEGIRAYKQTVESP